MAKPIFDIGQICELDKWETFINGQPFELFERLRREAPVYWHEESLEFEPGFWALTKHEDIITVSKDPQTFSTAVGSKCSSSNSRKHDWNGSSRSSNL